MKRFILPLILITAPAFPQDCIRITNYPQAKNRLAVVAGAAPNTLKINNNGYNISYSASYGVVGGLSYDRRLDYNSFLGIELLSNQTYLLRIGEEF